MADERALIPRVIRFEEKRFGPYPFGSAGIVVKDLKVGYALETQNRPVFDGEADTATIVHEFAHQWYGDSVTPRDWGDIWLNEGFADYSEQWWDAAHGGDSRAEYFTKVYDSNPETRRPVVTGAGRARRRRRISSSRPGLHPRRPDPGGLAADRRDRDFNTIMKRWASLKPRQDRVHRPVRRARRAGGRPEPRDVLPRLAVRGRSGPTGPDGSGSSPAWSTGLSRQQYEQNVVTVQR